MPKQKEVPPERRTWKAKRKLKEMGAKAKSRGDFAVWRRCKAVLGYLAGKSVADIAEELDAARSSVYGWLDWHIALGEEGLRTEASPGRPRRLTSEQENKLTRIIEDGPIAAGYSTGIWTGPMIADLIRQQMGVRYHHRHIPRLLHRLGFSVQRPRKRLAKADAEAQEYWIRKKLPAIKKRPDVVAES